MFWWENGKNYTETKTEKQWKTATKNDFFFAAAIVISVRFLLPLLSHLTGMSVYFVLALASCTPFIAVSIDNYVKFNMAETDLIFELLHFSCHTRFVGRFTLFLRCRAQKMLAKSNIYLVAVT